MPPDPVQIKALKYLERLRSDLLATALPTTTTTSTTSKPSFSSWFGSSNKILTTSAIQPRGVYLHGGVGCGKTFLMHTIFRDHLLKDSELHTQWHIQSHHFHAFMLHVHQELHQVAQDESKNDAEDHMEAVLNRMVHHTVVAHPNRSRPLLLLFDEFQVTDVADAMLLQRLFTGLWERQCVVVATSNRAPDDLYLNGLQRDRFLPFIAQLKEQCEVVSLWESDNDYRLVLRNQDDDEDGTNKSSVFFAGASRKKSFDRLFASMTANATVGPTSVTTHGRTVPIPQAAKGMCRFTFADLCQQAKSAADYIAIANNFHTIFLSDIPTLRLEHINWVRRFITCIDTMYEGHVKLILHTTEAATPQDIFVVPADSGEHDEVFAFDRTVSRLTEMSSQTYLLAARKQQ